MLTVEENERLTRVGPGTPMGNLMRRYWHPVAAVAQLEENPVKAVTLLGESLVLYRDKGGRLGLLAEACAHRRASLAYGIPEDEGLRCAYHGWRYNAHGLCIEQPVEPPGSAFKDPVTTTAYPVQELGGLIFAYLGPEPRPLVPRYNVLLWEDAVREINGTVIASNWLQVMENLMDPYHVECLHGRYFEYVLRRKGGDQIKEFLADHFPAHMPKIAFDLFENGIIERHMFHSEAEVGWKDGTPTFFPSTVLHASRQGSGLIDIVVPLDDTHTWFLVYVAAPSSIPIPPQEEVPFFDAPGSDETGKFKIDTANGQDHMAVVTQGDITRRDLEHLRTSDIGIILYRRLLMEQMERVEQGQDPINVYREPAKNQVISPPGKPKVPEAVRVAQRG